jgi:hypothetical protein
MVFVPTNISKKQIFLSKFLFDICKKFEINIENPTRRAYTVDGFSKVFATTCRLEGKNSSVKFYEFKNKGFEGIKLNGTKIM